MIALAGRTWQVRWGVEHDVCRRAERKTEIWGWGRVRSGEFGLLDCVFDVCPIDSRIPFWFAQRFELVQNNKIPFHLKFAVYSAYSTTDFESAVVLVLEKGDEDDHMVDTDME
jgi:hypothetical protein